MPRRRAIIDTVQTVPPAPVRVYRYAPARRPRMLIACALILFFVAAGALLGYEHFRSARAQKPSQDPYAALIARVSEFMVLPDEPPTFATVLDATKLPQNSFFARAENGDELLLFSQAKLAILYRPSLQKVIAVSAVNLGEGSSTPEQHGS